MSIAAATTRIVPLASLLACLLPMAAAAQAPGGPAPGGRAPDGAARTSAARDAAARRAPWLGVVDVLKAVEQYPRYIKLRQEWLERMQAFQAGQRQTQDQLNEMRATLQVLDEGTRERADKEFQYQVALQTADYRRKAELERLEVEDLRATLSAFEDLDYAIAKVAEEKGLLVVLKKQRIAPNPNPIAEQADREVQDRVRAYDRREVLWASEQVDITGDVIKFLQVPLPPRDAPDRAGKPPAGGADAGQAKSGQAKSGQAKSGQAKSGQGG